MEEKEQNMKKSIINWIAVLFALLLVAVMAGCGYVGTAFEGKTVSETVALEGVDTIRIEAGGTDAVLAAGGKDGELLAEMVTYGKGPELNVSERDGVVTIAIDKPAGLSVGRQPRLAVSLPDNYEGAVEIESGSGDVTADNLTAGDLTFDSGSGDFEVKSLKASRIDGRTSSGNIRIDAAESGGDIALSTSSGEIRLQKAESGGGIALKASSGDIELNAAGSAGDIKLSTSSGDIELELANSLGDIDLSTASGDASVQFAGERPGMRLDLESASGSKTVAFELRDLEQTKRTLKGIYGDGSRTLKIRTQSGDISVR